MYASAYCSPVALLASLDTNLSKEHGQKEANVPSDHVDPELVSEGGASREVGELLSNGGVEESEKR
jgi:hypothetical protein